MAKKKIILNNDRRYKRGYAELMAFKDLSNNRVLTIREYIRNNGKLSDLSKVFNITQKAAETLWVMYKRYTENDSQIGYKDSAYFEGDFPETPVYKLEDLEAEEKMISLKDTTTKLWTWEE